MAELLCLGEPLFELNAQPDGSFRPGFGGDVSNVAIAAARQGARAGLITRVGADPFGQALLALWRKEGVDTSHAAVAPGEETGLYFVTHDAEGHHFTYRRRGSAASRLGPDDLPEESVAAARIFYASGISLAVSHAMRAAVEAGIAGARRAGRLVAVDPNLRTALWPLEEAREVTHAVMRGCDIALPGLDDARRLTGLESPEAIAGFYHDLGAATVALTLGAEGVLISVECKARRIAPRRVRAIDATGAGDCFNGVFLASLIAGADAFEAGELANIGAALSTTGQGAVAPIPTRAAILAAREAAA